MVKGEDYRIGVVDPDIIWSPGEEPQVAVYFYAPRGFAGTVEFAITGPHCLEGGTGTLSFVDDLEDINAEDLFVSQDIPVVIGDQRGKYVVHAIFIGPSGKKIVEVEEKFFVK